jgi:hypothetical protein
MMLRDCSNITDDGLEYLKNSKEVYCNYLNKITDIGVKNLKNASVVEIINLAGYVKILMVLFITDHRNKEDLLN